MKRIVLSMLAIILLASLFMPVMIEAQQPNQLVLKGGYVANVVGFTKDGRAIYQVNFGSPQYCDDLKTKIDTQWYLQKDGSYKSGDNKYSSVVSNEQITVAKGVENIKWTPTLTLVGADKNGKDLQLKTAKVQPDLVAIDPMNSNYRNNTLVWHYDNGVDRYMRLIEGQCQEYFQINNVLVNDLVIDPHAVQTQNFKGYQKAIAYDDVNTGVKLTEDVNKKVTLKATSSKESSAIKDKPNVLKSLYKNEVKQSQQNQLAQGKEPEVMYPLVIDPNYTFVSSASDGFVFDSDAVYNTAWVNTTADLAVSNQIFIGVGQFDFGGLFEVERGALYFDTTVLSSAVTITAATLKLYGGFDYSDTDFNIQVQQGTTSVYPHDPLVVGDYDKTFYVNDGGTLTTVGWSTVAYNTLNLSAAGLTWINKGGQTKFMLRSSRDIAGIAPTGNEEVGFWAYEKGTGYWPQLIVTFTAANPAISAVAASNIAKYSARLNSTIIEDGGELPLQTEVRFGYGTTSKTAAQFATYDTITPWVSGWGLTSPNAYLDTSTIAPLVDGTTYYFRAQVKNSTATVTSPDPEQSFVTLLNVNDVTNFNGFPSTTSISLNWGIPSGASAVLIKYSISSYPTTTADGILVYNNSASTFDHTGLAVGKTYYYSIWGYSGATYSTNAKNLAMTTLGVSATTLSGGDTMPVPTLPASFNQPVDATKLSNFEPIYSIVNGFALSWGMPANTMWAIGVLLLIAIIGFLVLIESQNLMAAVIISTVLMLIAVAMTLLPAYFIVVAVLLDLGCWALEHNLG